MALKLCRFCSARKTTSGRAVWPLSSVVSMEVSQTGTRLSSRRPWRSLPGTKDASFYSAEPLDRPAKTIYNFRIASFKAVVLRTKTFGAKLGRSLSRPRWSTERGMQSCILHPPPPRAVLTQIEHFLCDLRHIQCKRYDTNNRPQMVVVTIVRGNFRLPMYAMLVV